MVKQYAFTVNIQPATFENGFVSVTYGLARDCRLAYADFNGSLSEGLAFLARVSAETPGPHVGFLRMKYRNDRKPAGFGAAETRIEKRTA